MSTTYQSSTRRRPTGRTWFAAAGSLAAVLVMLVLIAAACNARSEPTAGSAGEPGDPPTAGAGEANAQSGGDGGSAGSPGGSAGGDGGSAGSSGGSAGGDGATDKDPDPDPPEPEPEPVDPSAKDCVSYDPENLTVEAYGDAWRLLDGSHAMKLFDTKADAEDGRKVARNWTKLCFIGRGNDRPDRSRYIVEYWDAPSGLPFGLAPSFDCVSYDPENLTVEEFGDAWRLVDGPHKMLLLDSEADAERAKLVAGENGQLCFIGRGNERPDRYRFIMTYWRP